MKFVLEMFEKIPTKMKYFALGLISDRQYVGYSILDQHISSPADLEHIIHSPCALNKSMET